MYYRITGAPFTVRNAKEKKEFIEAINADENFSKHLICRGLNAEQFTGKVGGIVVAEKDNKNKVYIYNCEGNFPTLKLYQPSSSVVHVIEFPVSQDSVNVVENGSKGPEREAEPEQFGAAITNPEDATEKPVEAKAETTLEGEERSSVPESEVLVLETEVPVSADKVFVNETSEENYIEQPEMIVVEQQEDIAVEKSEPQKSRRRGRKKKS